MKKIMLILLVLILSISSGMVGMAEVGHNIRSHTIYRAGVDNHGFYRVFNATSHKLAPYENYTLNIKIGDTIVWINDVDYKRTIISNQKLWDNNSGILKWAYKQFIYTFNKSGIYTFYIKENNKQKQKIIVGPIRIESTIIPRIKKNHTITPTPTPTIIATPVPTKKTPTKTQTKTPTKTKPIEIFIPISNITQNISSLFSQFSIPNTTSTIRNIKDIKDENIRNRNKNIVKTPGFDIIIVFLSIMLIISIRYFRKE